MSKDTGGSAFPTQHYTNANGEVQWGADGMSLRDYFAAKAMNGILSRSTGCYLPDKEVAMQSYMLADAMLKAREA